MLPGMLSCRCSRINGKYVVSKSFGSLNDEKDGQGLYAEANGDSIRYVFRYLEIRTFNNSHR